jgi:Putative Ig domain/von Willebrand factor type A domain/Regulator of chromosome condensation (RCC1) repeat
MLQTAPAWLLLKRRLVPVSTKSGIKCAPFFWFTILAFCLAIETSHATGTVVAWGDNSHSQTNVLPGLTNVTAVAGGGYDSLALKRNGTVVGWGDNTYGETSIPANLSNVVAIAAGNTFSLALQSNGTAVAWGTPFTLPAGLVAISAAGSNSLALGDDGSVTSSWSTVGPPPADATNVVAIAAGYTHDLALRGDGTVIAWGNNDLGKTNVPSGLTNVVELAAGEYHSLALKADGTVVAWGDDTWGQSDVAGLSNVVEIAAGAFHTLALEQDGTVVAVGTNTYFQNQVPAGLSNVIGIAAGQYHNLAIIGDGSPVITVQPICQYNPATQTAIFHVMVVGQTPLNYQWQMDGANITGATNSALVLTNLSPPVTNVYSVIVTNSLGAATSADTPLPPAWQPCHSPLIFSPTLAAGKQGVAFSYAIAALHNPSYFSADGLPAGLTVNPTNGVIQGTPLESGVFDVTLGAANLCDSAQTNLTLTIASSVPVITSSLSASGTEQAAFYYQIQATESPTSFGAENLPQGLNLDPSTGIISGSPLYAGSFDTTILASNVWGVGAADLKLTIANERITKLFITDVTTNYSSPYLLDFKFSLLNNNTDAVVAYPQLLTPTAFESGQKVDTNSTAVLIEPASAKVLKAYLVLDFSENIASIPGGVDTEVSDAQAFVNQQPADAQIGVYEFHREDEAPQQVWPLDANKTNVDNAIAGIWTNYVQGFSAGSRCWDATIAAVNALGSPTNDDESHYVILMSNGQDTSSTNSDLDVIAAATNASVQVYCVGFGGTVNSSALQTVTSQTLGRYYEATNLTTLSEDFALIGKDLSGQYILRWATLRRAATNFMPSFQVTYQGITADSPTNPYYISNTNTVVDTNSTPPMTNITYIYTTNYIISPYLPTLYAGDVTVGSLFLEADADVHLTGITLRTHYVPRYVRQIHLHYQANWPCTVSLDSTNAGEMLYGWSLSQTNDGTGTNGQWLLLSSPNPQSLATSIPFASFGPLLTFTFHDALDTNSDAFSYLDVDNTIYTNTGGQSFSNENFGDFITNYGVGPLPYGTPIPWLIEYGFTNPSDWVADETNLAANGMPIWQNYAAGLNPTNASSVFVVESLAPTGQYGHYQITFSTELNRTYRVEASSDLVHWTTLVDNIAGTGGDVTVTDPRISATMPQTYYRVAVY